MGQEATGMTEDRTRGQSPPLADLVAEAEAQVLRAGRRLGALIERLEAEDLSAGPEVAGAIAALDKALGAVFHERARRERMGGEGACEGQLDLAAARAEVERRLARLRASLGAGVVPGGTE